MGTLCFFVSPIACDVCGIGTLKDALWRWSLPENVCYPPSPTPTLKQKHTQRHGKNLTNVRRRRLCASMKDYSYVVAIHIRRAKGFPAVCVLCQRCFVLPNTSVRVLLTFLYMKFYVRDLDVFVYSLCWECVCVCELFAVAFDVRRILNGCN